MNNKCRHCNGKMNQIDISFEMSGQVVHFHLMCVEPWLISKGTDQESMDKLKSIFGL